jgi:outer membrane cobalamin receptor
MLPLSVLIATACAALLLPTPALADTLRGRVLDPADRPVAAARVVVLRGQIVIATLETAADGRFGPLPLAPGRYEIVLAAPGLRLAPRPITVTADAALDLDLRPALAAVGESVVVSAAHVDAPSSRVTDSVTVIDRETLEALQIDSVAEALQQTPGFSVVSSGGQGAITSLFPRGGESDYTLVLVDGIAQNTFGGDFDAAHLATADVDRIEVVRGPQSALYGAGAIGGIVHILTTHGGHLRGAGRIEAGGYGTAATSGSIAASRGPWTFGGGIDWLDTDGDDRVLASGARVQNDDYSRTSGSASIGWSDDPRRRVRLNLQGGRNERGVPGPYGSDPDGLYDGIDTISRGTNENAGAGLNARFAQGASLFHHADVTWSDATGRYVSPFGPSSSETRRMTGRYQLDLAHDRVPVSGGAEWLAERADSTFVTGETFEPVPVERSSAGFFFETRPALTRTLFVTAGVRVERIERQALEADGFSRPAFDPHVVWSANPKLSVAWMAREGGGTGRPALGWTKVRLGAGSGIKAPTAFEIAFTDNPDLQPERSRSVDIGLEQAFADSKVIADVTWFRNTYDDLIVTVGQTLAGASRYRSDNIANARARGIELGASVRPLTGLLIRASWSWLDTEVLDIDQLPGQAPAPYTVGDRLLRRPRASGSLDVRWSRSRASAFVSLSGRGAMLDLEPNFASRLYDNPGFVTGTIGGSLRLAGAIAIYGRVANAFDREYEDVLGFPARGRSASMGVRVTTGR